MSKDIVEQLREYAEDWQIDRSVVDRAANEIERLRALVEASIILAHPGSLTVNCVRGSVSCQEAKRLRARVEVLERALRRIQATPHPSVAAQCTNCYNHQKTATYALEDAAP
jgi:stress response protein YsnF